MWFPQIVCVCLFHNTLAPAVWMETLVVGFVRELYGKAAVTFWLFMDTAKANTFAGPDLVFAQFEMFLIKINEFRVLKWCSIYLRCFGYKQRIFVSSNPIKSISFNLQISRIYMDCICKTSSRSKFIKHFVLCTVNNLLMFVVVKGRICVSATCQYIDHWCYFWKMFAVIQLNSSFVSQLRL